MSKVWYACYGSNISFERFRYYITGGTYKLTGKEYKGCRDSTPPTESAPILIPYEMYFGNASSSWDGCGVAFLDISRPSVVLGRAYLITDEQFKNVHCQEGASSMWYDKIVDLGIYRGYPIKTFTNSIRQQENPPSAAYLRVIEQGMRELLGAEVIIANIQEETTRA